MAVGHPCTGQRGQAAQQWDTRVQGSRDEKHPGTGHAAQHPLVQAGKSVLLLGGCRGLQATRPTFPTPYAASTVPSPLLPLVQAARAAGPLFVSPPARCARSCHMCPSASAARGSRRPVRIQESAHGVASKFKIGVRRAATSSEQQLTARLHVLPLCNARNAWRQQQAAADLVPAGSK